MRFVLSTALVLAATWIGSISSAATAETSEGISKFTSTYHGNGSAVRALTSIEAGLPPEAFAFLSERAHHENLKDAPVVSKLNEDTVVIKFRGHMVTEKILNSHAIELNGQTIDFNDIDLPTQWARVIGALPKFDTAARSPWFVNEAYAEDNAERLTGGVLLGTGAIGVATGAGTVVTGGLAAGAAATGVGLVVMAGAYFVWNNGTCVGMGKEKFECAETLDEAEALISKNKKRAELMEKHQPANCSAAKDSTKSHEIAENISKLINNDHELFRKVVTCRQTHRELQDCIQKLALTAYYGCVNMHGLSDERLPAYARGGAAFEHTSAPARAGKSKK